MHAAIFCGNMYADILHGDFLQNSMQNIDETK